MKENMELDAASDMAAGDALKDKKAGGFGKGLLFGAVGTCAVFAAFNMVLGGLSGAGKSELDINRISSKLAGIEKLVDRYFLFEEDHRKMEDGIYTGMMEALDDPYSVYYNEEDYKSLTETTEGTYYGIGAVVSQDPDSGVVTVLSVFEGSPAEKGGMKKGDILYTVNGVECSGMDLDLLVKDYIRGEEGTRVDITVVRGEDRVDLRIVRGKVEMTTATGEMLDEETGYIAVSQFDVNTTDQFKGCVEKLETQGMKKLVLDFRDNPGGVLDTAVDMLAYMLPEDQMDGVLISTANKNGKGFTYYCSDGMTREKVEDGSHPNTDYPKEDGHQVDMPVVCLVNGNSASASEVFCGAMRDYGRAKLVGTTTFGKGIVQNLFALGDGTAVKITIAHYYTPSGFDLHEKGLDPDVEVEFKIPEDYDPETGITHEQDNQLQKALEILKSE